MMKYLLTIFLFFLTLNSHAQPNLFIPANGASPLFYWTRIIDGIGQGMTARIGVAVLPAGMYLLRIASGAHRGVSLKFRKE
jgi:hypothetical protein